MNVREWLRRVFTRHDMREACTDPLKHEYDPNYSRVSRIDIQRMPGRTTNWPVTTERFSHELNEEHE